MESELEILFNLAKVRQHTVEVHVYVTNFKSTMVLKSIDSFSSF